MANTGWKVPTTAVFNAGTGPFPARDWSGTPLSVVALQSADGISLSAIVGNTTAAGGSTRAVIAGGFGFVITGSITNIEVRYRLKIDGPDQTAGEFAWRAWLLSGVVSASYSTYGSPANLTAAQGVDASLSAYTYVTATPSVNYSTISAIVNTTSFGVLSNVDVQSGSLLFPSTSYIDLDKIEMRITYSPTTPQAVTPRIRTTKPLLVKHYFATGM